MTRYAQRTLIQQPTLANWGKAAAAGASTLSVDFLVVGGGGGSGGVSLFLAGRGVRRAGAGAEAGCGC